MYAHVTWHNMAQVRQEQSTTQHNIACPKTELKQSVHPRKPFQLLPFGSETQSIMHAHGLCKHSHALDSRQPAAAHTQNIEQYIGNMGPAR